MEITKEAKTEYSNLVFFLLRLRRLSDQQRFGTSLKLRPKSIADHIAHGSIILSTLFEHSAFGDWSDTEKFQTLQAWNFHDIEESELSDIPFTIKERLSKNPGFNETLKKAFTEVVLFYINNSKMKAEITKYWDREDLSDKIKHLIKFVDHFELCLHCLEEYWLGNTAYSLYLKECLARFRKNPLVNSTPILLTWTLLLQPLLTTGKETGLGIANLAAYGYEEFNLMLDDPLRYQEILNHSEKHLINNP